MQSSKTESKNIRKLEQTDNKEQHETGIKRLLAHKSPGPGGFTGEFIKHSNEQKKLATKHSKNFDRIIF